MPVGFGRVEFKAVADSGQGGDVARDALDADLRTEETTQITTGLERVEKCANACNTFRAQQKKRILSLFTDLYHIF